MPAITMKWVSSMPSPDDLDQVDGPVLAGERDVDGGPQVERDVEVAGQQVAGAGRDDPDRDAGAGELGAHLAHGAVAAAHQHQVGAGDRRRPRPCRCPGPRRSCSATTGVRPAGLGGHRGHDRRGTGRRPRPWSGLRTTASWRSERIDLGQRLRGLGMAARQRAVERQPEQHHAGAEQRSRRPRRWGSAGRAAPGRGRRRARAARQPAYTSRRSVASADQHRRRARSGRRPSAAELRGVAGRERLARPACRSGSCHVGRARPTSSLMPVVSQRGRRPSRPTVKIAARRCPRSEQRHGDQGRPDRHPDGPEGDLDRPQRRDRSPDVRRPTPRRCGRGRRTVQRSAAPAVDQRRRAPRTAPNADAGPGQDDGAGAVEHGRQYAGRPRRTGQRGRVTDVLTRASPG